MRIGFFYRRELIVAANLLLIAVKNGEIIIFPKNENTPDYLQGIENALKKIKTPPRK